MSDTFTIFKAAAEAIKYRRDSGCGGYIYVCDDNGEAIIFPPHMTATPVMLHALVRGRNGTMLA